MSKIRVLMADDHAILREGLRALLSYYNDIEVVGEAEDGAQAIARVNELSPDVVLMDIAMPGMNGVEATRIIRQRHPETRVLVLTQHEDRQYVLPLLQAGASGYVSKRALGNDLIGALRVVARGETFLYPSAATAVVEELRHQEGNGSVTESITPRELEILQHIVLGETNSQIASALSISVKTVEWHRANLMSKLGAHTVADLVRYALEHGLTEKSN
ncbi:MAG: response regulator transcription factor [Chloroflexi bacterium]|nr:response regulator transcription factor [Chloroflexota bacterium]